MYVYDKGSNYYSTIKMCCNIIIFYNLGTNKLQESADDKKTWKQKTDEVLHVRRALDSALSV